MGVLDDVKDKVEGKVEQVQGEAVEKFSGTKGGVKKMKGKLKEKVADAKMDWDTKKEES